MEGITVWPWVMALNWIATAIWCCVLIPQSYKTIKTKDTYSVSLIMYILYPINALLWIAYASFLIYSTGMLDNVGIIFTDSIGFALAVVILYVKAANLLNSKKLKMTELQYYEEYLKGKKDSKIILRFEAWLKHLLKLDKDKKNEIEKPTESK